MFSLSVMAAEKITVGMTAALTGPSAALGKEMQAGIASYFHYVNSQGGVGGRKLKLIVKDDGYEPERAGSNMRSLIEEDNVVAVIGNVGTPTAVVTVPIAKKYKTVLFGAFSGGDVLRTTPPSRYVINYRSSYAAETTEMVDGLLESGIEPTQIAFFTQRDSYGDSGFRGAKKALEQHGFTDISQLAHGRYTRNTVNVEDAVATILDAPIEPKAIIMAGGSAASAKFITLLQHDMPDVLFLNLSFVDSHSLKKALENDVENVIVMQVVPHWNAELPIIEEYLARLQQYDVSLDANFVSLEGYIAAKIFHHGLLNIDGEISKESIIDGLEMLSDLDIGLGVNIELNRDDHQAIDKLWLSYLKDGHFNLFSWDELSWMKER
ncbi:ligand-binding receptor [Methylophaga sp. 42_25_T18]|nr:ligand-binding receptor [Methylophaga sp. 42_25_T18]OUR87720.1 ligand-binding receptor [Methylophaga sp. 42_8_T64]